MQVREPVRWLKLIGFPDAVSSFYCREVVESNGGQGRNRHLSSHDEHHRVLGPEITLLESSENTHAATRLLPSCRKLLPNGAHFVSGANSFKHLDSTTEENFARHFRN